MGVNYYLCTRSQGFMRRYNYIFDGTLKAGHDFTYKYDPKDPFRLLSVDAKEYRSSTEEVDTTRREHSYAFDGNGNLVLQLSDLAERIDSASFADTAAMQVRQYLWDEDNHLLAINDNGFVSNYFYDAAGERTVKISAPDLAVFVNGTESTASIILALFDEDGREVFTSNPIPVPVKSDRHTIMRGEFLTIETSGGVGIKPGFDGEYNYERTKLLI